MGKSLLKLSTSSIKAYEHCPRQYYFRYIEKPEIPEVVWDHLILGNFVHSVLEFFHNILKKDSNKNFNQVMGFCARKIQQEKDKKGDLKYPMSDDVKAEAKALLKDYLRLLEETGLPNVQANEKKFNVHLSEDVLIRGVIDRIDLGNKEDSEVYHIVDYKTGKSKYLDEFQLLVYGIELLENNPDLEAYEASYLVLKENMKWLSFSFSRTDVEKVRKKILDVAQQIREDQSWEPRPQFLCKWCDYNELCDASPLRQEGRKIARGGEINWD